MISHRLSFCYGLIVQNFEVIIAVESKCSHPASTDRIIAREVDSR